MRLHTSLTYKLSNWMHTMSTPCCFLNVPVETARALQMSTAVRVIFLHSHRLPYNKEDKLSVLVSSTAGPYQVLPRMIYSFICLFIHILNNSSLLFDVSIEPSPLSLLAANVSAILKWEVIKK